ncbi:cell wall metabolism sensor histidine kinase WalK [Streptomyces sp. wa1063]|uniref:sensor histidine kinase n=1 Tax=Streptomyces sp. wa1063 TaxID=1828212 RepID=UPI000BF1F5BF|nr:HAMP domain-containing sensor histidine kinase [Streptomyces sp. wa1063]
MLRRPWTLRTRLVVSAVSLIAVVAAVIGSVTAIAFHSYMYGKLDDQLHSVAERAQRPPGPGPLPQALRAAGPLGFVGGGGQPLGTFGALLGEDGDVTASKVVEDSGLRAQESAKPLTGEQRSALEEAAPGTGEGARSVDLPGLGGYRVEAATTTEGDTVLVGIPSAEVSGALTTLIVVEVCVTAAGLLAASIAGTVLVGVALRPLRRVAATATRVSELPLHSGEVALLERVPDAEADPRTEVGQVGAALNRMLGHVGSALTARQESETRVRQFVADASHELRTPLASIRGYAELTRRATGSREAPEPDPVTRHALGRIESEADRMTGLVEDLLLLARLDSGRPLSYGSTDLLPLVVDAISDARAADQGAPGQDARHRWRLELPAEPVTVRADPDRFQQVLVNLLANARTHTPPGTTVTVSVRPPVRAGGRVTLEVRDDGPGIPAELLPHVFERFARGDASRSRGAGRGTGEATGSTGLGLAIVQAVVSAHGGRVRVDSEPGRTVFVIELPVGAGEARPADSAEADEALRPDSAGAETARRADSAGAETARRADSQGGDRLSTPV